jgi:hypothetical protein
MAALFPATAGGSMAPSSAAFAELQPHGGQRSSSIPMTSDCTSAIVTSSDVKPSLSFAEAYSSAAAVASSTNYFMQQTSPVGQYTQLPVSTPMYNHTTSAGFALHQQQQQQQQHQPPPYGSGVGRSGDAWGQSMMTSTTHELLAKQQAAAMFASDDAMLQRLQLQQRHLAAFEFDARRSFGDMHSIGLQQQLPGMITTNYNVKQESPTVAIFSA